MDFFPGTCYNTTLPAEPAEGTCDMEYNKPIARFQAGDAVEGFYILKSAAVKTSANGKPAGGEDPGHGVGVPGRFAGGH